MNMDGNELFLCIAGFRAVVEMRKRIVPHGSTIVVTK
jgi:hypothetical protein